MNSVISIFEKLGMVERIEELDNKTSQTESIIQEKIQEKIVDAPKEDNVKLNKLSSIQEIYKSIGLSCDLANTIFIVDSFSKALPENLPTAVKRQTVLNLISTSGMDMKNILNDGKKRLKELSAFDEKFSSRTDNLIAEKEAEIKRLVQLINDHKRQINELKKLKQEQKATVDFEIQKVQGIIEFIESENYK